MATLRERYDDLMEDAGTKERFMAEYVLNGASTEIDGAFADGRKWKFIRIMDRAAIVTIHSITVKMYSDWRSQYDPAYFGYKPSEDTRMLSAIFWGEAAHVHTA